MTVWLGLFPVVNSSDTMGSRGIEQLLVFMRRFFGYQEMMDYDIIPLRTLLREDVR